MSDTNHHRRLTASEAAQTITALERRAGDDPTREIMPGDSLAICNVTLDIPPNEDGRIGSYTMRDHVHLAMQAMQRQVTPLLIKALIDSGQQLRIVVRMDMVVRND